MKQEWFARVILVLFLVLAGRLVGAGRSRQESLLTVRARMPEKGGWLPGELQAVVGQPLQLRLTSDDVIHSFAIGKLEIPAVDLYPGEYTRLNLTFEQPGRYTFYCTRWCGPNHWRMRGTIEVSGRNAKPLVVTTGSEQPLYAELGLDIDAPHPARVTPAGKPGVDRSLRLEFVPEKYHSSWYIQTHSPSQVWESLRAETANQGLTESQIWALVVELWQSHTDLERLNQGKALYNQNCAACHGMQGAGDGVFAAMDVATLGVEGHDPKTPTDFTDPASMLGASPALLYGKILRGGMGSGMPYWGPVFTADQIWTLVEYLWTYQFDYQLEVNHEQEQNSF